jgi:GTP-binding protein
VIADIPGLIEGASGGAGLGHEFLAHVERTRLLVHVLEIAPLDGSDPVANHAIVERELREYDPRLAALPRVLALSKCDLVPAVEAQQTARAWRKRLDGESPVLLTSSVTRMGLSELSAELLRAVPLDAGEPDGSAVSASAPGELAEHKVFRPAAPRAFEVTRSGPHRFTVAGQGIERLVARYDLDNADAVAHLERRLRGIGVIRALESQGFEPGDDVEIAGIEFVLDPGA